MGRPEAEPQRPAPSAPGEPAQAAAGPTALPEQEPATEEELQARMGELRQQLAETPVELVVANHCFGMFELAALHLSLQPPRLDQARVAIDALAALLDALKGRLGEEEPQLQEGLASLRLAYVQIQGATGSAPGPSEPTPPPA